MFHLASIATPQPDFWHTLKDTFRTDLAAKISGTALLVIGYAGANGFKLAKAWYQHGNPVEKQTALCQEAERLLKLRSTLATSSDAPPRISSAQAVVANQLNQVLEKLSHLLTEPEAAHTNSRAMEVAGKYLLLYRAPGILSALMHGVFYLMTLFWTLTVIIGFTEANEAIGMKITIALVLLFPVALWNYVTRKLDRWLSSRHVTASSVRAPRPV